MVYVQDINGKPMMPTTRHGKVRRLLKENKAVVVSLCPFTIKLMYVTSDYKQEGDGKESFSFNVILVKQLIETFEIMLQDIYSDNYKLKVYAGNCIAQLNVNPKDSSESFFDVYDKDETKLIYGIEIGILKEMFGI